MELNELLMCQGVQRWHIVEMSRTQTVAEHSFNVAMIAAEFAALMGIKGEDVGRITCMSLFHDADEVHSGDVPAIAKKPPVLKSSLAMRAIQIADKLEAYWFAHHYAIGPRRQFVVEDTRLRFTKLVQISRPNEQRIWVEVERRMEHE